MICPKCGQEIDDKETKCPYCGKSLIGDGKYDSNELVNPKDPSWVNKWRKKDLNHKLSFGICFTVFLLIAIILTIVVANGHEGAANFFMILCYFFAIIMLVSFIVSLFVKRFCVGTFDGYSVVYYYGIKYNVFVEDEFVSNKPTEYVYPEKKQFVVTLPNKKVVNVDIYPYSRKIEIYEENKL